MKTINDIIYFIASETKIPVSEITGPTRKRPISEKRQIGMFIARGLKEDFSIDPFDLPGPSDCKYSLDHIAFEFGGRGHATCIHGIKTVKNLMETSDKFNKKVVNLCMRWNSQLSDKLEELLKCWQPKYEFDGSYTVDDIDL
jgi:chromosomal replication initiation ATPase DnaA